LRLEGADAIELLRYPFSFSDFRIEQSLLAVRGDDLALTRDRAWFVDGHAGLSEVETLSVFQSGPDGRVVVHILFDADALDAAYAALDARYAELNIGEGNVAWRAALQLSDAQARHDWKSVRDVLDPTHVYVDHRQGIRLRLH